MSNLPDRIDVLEAHVLGQDAEKPGVLMRLDRQERQLRTLLEVVKFMVLGGGLATVWKIVDFAIEFKTTSHPN